MTIPLTRFSEQIFRLCHYDYVSKKKFWKIFWIFFGIFLLNFFSGFFFDEKCYDLVLLTFRYNSKVDHLFLNRQPLGDSLRCYMEILFSESHWLELRKLLMFLFRHQILFQVCTNPVDRLLGPGFVRVWWYLSLFFWERSCPRFMDWYSDTCRGCSHAYIFILNIYVGNELNFGDKSLILMTVWF